MTQEQIEKQAKEYADFPSIDIFEREDIRDAYLEGANWRINSVWHPFTERPEDGKMVLAISRNQHPFIAGPNNAEWDDMIREVNITRWAYVEDLVPEEDKK